MPDTTRKVPTLALGLAVLAVVAVGTAAFLNLREEHLVQIIVRLDPAREVNLTWAIDDNAPPEFRFDGAVFDKLLRVRGPAVASVTVREIDEPGHQPGHTECIINVDGETVGYQTGVPNEPGCHVDFPAPD